MTSAERPVRAVAYVRVSTEREGMISPELQLTAVRDYCEHRGYVLVETIEDVDLSGRFWTRRHMEQAIAMVEDHAAEVIVVWRWSRVSRNRFDWAMAVDRVERAGGQLESATEGFDPTTSTGRFARGMLAEFAAFESDRVGDVWREVQDRRVRLGLTPTGHPQFGYRKSGGSYLVDQKTGPILTEMYRRYNDGASFAAITTMLNRRRVPKAADRYTGTPWHQGTLPILMDRGFGAGYILAYGVRLVGAHQAVISETVWLAYRRRREDTVRGPRHVPLPPMWLDGLVFCTCGRPMTAERGGPTRPSAYRCRTHRGGTHLRNIVERRLTGLVFRWLDRLAFTASYAATARIGAQQRADDSAATARVLAREVSSGPASPALQREYELASAGSRFLDPVLVARELVEDWAQLSDTVKRERLTQLMTRITVRTGHSTATITAHTTWGTSLSYSAGDVTQIRCESSFQERWLSPIEALRLTGVAAGVLRYWRTTGVLPMSKRDVTTKRQWLYALSDLDRVLATPRTPHNGHNLRRVRAAITATSLDEAAPSVDDSAFGCVSEVP